MIYGTFRYIPISAWPLSNMLSAIIRSPKEVANEPTSMPSMDFNDHFASTMSSLRNTSLAFLAVVWMYSNGTDQGYQKPGFLAPKPAPIVPKIFGDIFTPKLLVFYTKIFAFLHQNYWFFTPKFLVFYTNFFTLISFYTKNRVFYTKF